MTLDKVRICVIFKVEREGRLMDKRLKQFRLSHKRTLEILKYHGITFRMNTGALNGREAPNTSFFDSFGIKQYYTYREVMEWLGY